ncbi:MAG: BlaI/MecI/CopY family transcriptional regulator [Phycisphaerae bacterium]|nr:BlaI/MecI/CopY family transcriptional regulator [Phycisphaerae bacterium]
MARPPSETLTQRESQIMDVLWDQGQATADQVRTTLPDGPHDSTVRTLLRVLEHKGYVRHKTRGKAYLFIPAVKREQVERKALSTVLKRFFGGSAEALVLRLIEDEQLSPEQLDELRRTGKGKSATSRRGDAK